VFPWRSVSFSITSARQFECRLPHHIDAASVVFVVMRQRHQSQVRRLPAPPLVHTTSRSEPFSMQSSQRTSFFSFYQIRFAEEDVPKTAFCTPFGHYEWRVLPMGLTNAPSSFMRAMNSVFSEFIGDFVLVYLDDILVMSKTPTEHLQHLRWVFAKKERKKELRP
jgi:hypothetical protein